MVGWHHRLNGHEFEQTLGDSEGQGSPACCSPRGCNSATEQPHHRVGASKDFAILASDFQCLDFPGLLLNTQKGRKRSQDLVFSNPPLVAAELGRNLKSRASIRISGKETSSSWAKPQLEQQLNSSQMTWEPPPSLHSPKHPGG